MVSVRVAIVALLAALAFAPASAAHPRSKGYARGFQSKILSVRPEVVGLEVVVVDADDRLRVSNKSGTNLVVLGYDGEPYLRIGPDGVYRNERSPAAYLNRDRFARISVPLRADPGATPEWRHVSPRPAWQWHDHRIQWMGAGPPAQVRSAPKQTHAIFRWNVPGRLGDRSCRRRRPAGLRAAVRRRDVGRRGGGRRHQRDRRRPGARVHASAPAPRRGGRDGAGMIRALALAGVIASLVGGSSGWQRAAPLPLARSEVAAAPYGSGIVIVGGYVAGGTGDTARADLYLPATNRWRRLPDYPIQIDHAAAASDGKHTFFVGGFNGKGTQVRLAYALTNGRWHRLPSLPAARAASGAAIVDGKLYVVGGFAGERLAGEMLAFDLRTHRWSTAPGP